MSKSNVKIFVIASAIAVFGGGGYFAYSMAADKSASLTSEIEVFAKKLPSSYKFENISHEMGLMETTGSVKLTYNNPNNKDLSGSILFSYTVEHDQKLFLGGDIDFTGEAVLEGNIAKTLKVKTGNPSFAKINGTFKEDGSVKVSQEIGELSLVLSHKIAEEQTSNYSVKTKGVKSELVFGNDISHNITASELIIENQDDTSNKIFVKGLSFQQAANSSTPELGKTAIKLASVDLSNLETKLEKVDTVILQELKNKLYNIKLDLKIDKLNNVANNNASFEFKGALNGLDKDAFKVLSNLGTTYLSNQKITEKEEFVSGLHKGLTFSIENMSYKNESDLISLKGKYELTPLEEGGIFNLSKQSSFNFNINSEGALLSSWAIGKVEPEKVLELKNPTKTDFSYSNNILKINDIEASTELTSSFTDFLSQLSSSYGFEQYSFQPILPEETAPKQ